jgi:hypothetical protein
MYTTCLYLNNIHGSLLVTFLGDYVEVLFSNRVQSNIKVFVWETFVEMLDVIQFNFFGAEKY